MEALEKKTDAVIFEKADYQLLISLVGIIYLDIRTSYEGYGGFWFSLFSCFIVGMLFFYIQKKQINLTKKQAIILTYISLFAFSFSVVENPIFLGVNALWLFLVTGYWLFSVLQVGNETVVGFFQSIFYVPFQKINQLVPAFQKNSRNQWQYIVGGFVISLPILSIVLGLLASADDYFDLLLQHIVDLFSENIIRELVFILVAIGLASYLFMYVYQNMRIKISHSSVVTVTLPNLLLKTILSVFIVTYIVFFTTALLGYVQFSQSATATSGVANYARSGFFQLLAVALINVGIFVLSRWLSGNVLAVRSYLTVIGIETLGLIALGLAKMWLYISLYGLTILRYNTSWFMGLLFVCVIFFIASLWKKFSYIKWSGIVIACGVLFLSYQNPANQIIAYNYQQYQAEKLEDFDFSVVEELGVATAPTVLKIYQTTTDDQLKVEAKEALERIQLEIKESSRYVTWQRQRDTGRIQRALKN